MTDKRSQAFALSWYWNRLQCMSVAEIGYRVQQKLVAHLQRMGLATAAHPPQPNLARRVQFFTGSEGGNSICPDTYKIAADEILRGKLHIFTQEYVAETPQWNLDIKTGTLAPLDFGKLLNYRNEALVGDIKYLWEPNRHLQLVTLAQAYHSTGDNKYLDGIREQLASWIDQCPYLFGPNWTSSLELGIRLINWSLCWQLIGGLDSRVFQGKEGQHFLKIWLDSIYQHMHFIYGHFSKFSSANNHLIGEAAGLFVATVTWPYWPETRKWGKAAKDILEREALLQNAPDGVNREQAISYQQFVLDFLIISELAGRANGLEFSAEYLNRIELMLEFLASVMDVSGNIPMIGDADDGYAVRLSTDRDFCPYRSLLATGAVLFGRADFKTKAKEFDDKSRWLLGETGKRKFQEIVAKDVKLPIKRKFSKSGYYILGKAFETSKEIRLLVDAGPLGYQRIAAHGHADALSIWLSVAGREFLIDPGTYAYHTMKKWRNYFRGTYAHNTVVLDARDQSEIGGNFMWLRHATAQCDIFQHDSKADNFSGRHNGYTALRDPVTHRRKLMLDKERNLIECIDIIECKDVHTVERCWHFSEHCDVELDEKGTIKATNAGVRILMIPKGGILETTIMSGQEDPPAGWVSRSFDSKIKTTTIIWKNTISGPATLETKIYCQI